MQFEWDSAAFQELLNGPILNDLVSRAIRVEAAAKQNATDRPGPRVVTGRLRGSITWQTGQSTSEGAPYVDIGSNVTYAPYVELGHNVVRNGVVVGYAQPRPYLVPALQAARTT